MNILVIGDEHIIADDAQRTLQQLGHGVVAVVVRGAEALEQLRRHRPQLVLLALRAQGVVEGAALADQIRAEFDVPVVYLTSRADRDAAPWDDIEPLSLVSEPLDERTLQSAIDTALARHASERRVRASEHRLATALSSIGEAVLLIDERCQLTFLNPAAERLGGWDAAQVVGQRLALVLRLIDERSGQVVDLPLAQVLQEGQSVALDDLLIQRPDGTCTLVGGSIAPLPGPAGAISGAVLVLRDLTERRRAEQQRLDFERRLLEKQKVESLGVLSGGIAHDFNNLLATIMGNAELALFDLEPDSPVYGPVTVLITAARRAANLTRQLLVYSGRAKVMSQPHNLNHLVQEMSTLLRASVHKAIRLDVQLDPEVPSIETDVAQLRQVIMNLATNAAEAIGAQEGTVTISTALREVDASYLAAAPLTADLVPGSYICLEVRDTGPGMDADTQGRIFDPFFSTKFVGRGLGLAAVLGIARGHGGAVRVVSAPGQGSTLTVLLPCPAPELAAAPPELAELPGWPAGGRVLVIDDDVDVCEVVQQILGRYGFTTIAANDGNSGFALFRQHRDEIVCVLLDLTMPEPTGEQVFEMIRQLSPGARVVLMSGYSREEAVGRLHGERLAGFLQKPFSALELAASVRGVLR